MDSLLTSAPKPSSGRHVVAVLLSLSLGLFLAAAVVSLLDDSLALLFGVHWLSVVNGLLGCLAFLLALLIYAALGITPLIPKHVFLPVIMVQASGLLSMVPVMIYRYQSLLLFDWLFSLLQAVLVLVILLWLRVGGNRRWMFLETRHLGAASFRWRHLVVFILLNVFVILPAFVVYLAVCASLAVSHFTDGFLALRPSGLIMRAKTFVRQDGKTVLLFPMSHIAESDFYQAVAHAASSNSVVLLEGVSDEHHLLTNGISYKRAAKSLGLAEQHEDLHIVQGERVRADVDVGDFSPGTIALLNLIGLVHAQGLTPATLLPLMEYSPPPEVERLLVADILEKRNQHLLKELRDRLPNSDHFLIPWGAVHMPGIADAIQQSGFRLAETHEFVSIRFGSKGNHRGAVEKLPQTEEPR